MAKIYFFETIYTYFASDPLETVIEGAEEQAFIKPFPGEWCYVIL